MALKKLLNTEVSMESLHIQLGFQSGENLLIAGHPSARVYLPGTSLCSLSVDPSVLTSDLPRIGGAVGADWDDFHVHELPRTFPTGEGDHCMALILKVGRTTEEALTALAHGSGVSGAEIGYAGRKDRDSISTQWFSLPTLPASVASTDEQVIILHAAAHPQKLKLGYSEGNLFTIRVRDLAHPEEVESSLARIGAGIPNYFGPQRFGRPFYTQRPPEGYQPPIDENGIPQQDPDNPARDNVDRALLLLKRADGQRRSSKGKNRRDEKLIFSALQSALFNLWVGERIQDGLFHKVILGDVCRKRGGGTFTSTEPSIDTERLHRGEIEVLGPLLGPKIFPARDEALAREERLYSRWGLTSDLRSQLGRSWRGDRRALSLRPYALSSHLEKPCEGGPHLRLSFILPSGSFATSVLAALINPEFPFARAGECSRSE